MVAVVKFGKSLRRTLNYNENKVKDGVATCISAVNYPKDLKDLTFSDKLNMLSNMASLRKTVTTNSVHISLNFHPTESFPHEKLNAIADSYMKQIGFGNQPYLVYEHIDAGHPHIHIVTVKVDEKGNRIETQNIGKIQSSNARRQIEKEFKLIPAEGQKTGQIYMQDAVNSKVVSYGKSATKQAIANVLEKVLDGYNFTSLHELNAVLKLFNVTADRGKEDGIVFRKQGLYYRVLDNKTGKMIGVPIKASDFHFQPTLARLQERYGPNQERIEIYQKKRIRNAIDINLNRAPKISLQQLIASLKKQGIDTVLRQKNATSPIYGLTFVDHTTRLVINGSDLGTMYSANFIQQRCKPVENPGATSTVALPKAGIPSAAIPEKNAGQNKFPIPAAPGKSPAPHVDTPLSTPDEGSGKSLLEVLIDPEYQSEYVPYHLRLRRRKRKKNRYNNNN